MSAYNLSFVFFIGSIIFYGIIAQKQARKIESPYDFYNRGGLVRNLYSWTAANITLGTGLFYILASGYTMGLLFICAPIALLLGYFALSQFCSKVLPDTIWKHGNLYKGFGSIIDQFSESNTYFTFILSTISVFVFTLILSFEIFVSSKFISICLFSESGQIQQLLISIGVFIAALLYSIWGGFPAVIGDVHKIISFLKSKH